MKLTATEQDQWRDHAGHLLDPFCDAPVEEIELDDYGRLHVASTITTGVYLVLDADDHVVFIGSVDGTADTVDDRFRSSYAAADTWDRVWILPLRPDVDPGPLAHEMVDHFQPPAGGRDLTCP